MPSNYQDYIFAQLSDSERQQAQFKAFRPSFMTIIERLLNEYGLSEMLKAAQTESRQVRILQVGCGEGFYLHALAEQLERQGLLSGAELNGIDNDTAMIGVAYDYSRLSQPARPYLNFYVHNPLEPLETALGLLRQGEARFDFIFMIGAATKFGQVPQLVKTLFEALRPGGIILSRDLVLKEGPEGWHNSYRSTHELVRLLFGLMLKQTGGVEVALQMADWFKEIGSLDVQALTLRMSTGGDTEEGKNYMRQSVISLYNARSVLLALKLITPEQFDKAMRDLYAEVTRDKVGFMTYIDTLGRRPEEARP